MKTYYIKIVVFLLLANSSISQSVFIVDGKKVEIKPNIQLQVNGSIEITGNAGQSGVLVNEGKLGLTGDWHNDHNYGNYRSTAGNVVFNGTNQQELTGKLKSENVDNDGFFNIEINNASNVFLWEDMEFFGTLDFVNGKIDIYENDLIFGSTALTSGANSDRFIRTSSNGMVYVPVQNEENFTIPVGNNSYNPVIIKNNDVLNNFKVRVLNNVLENGDSGNPVIDDVLVNRSWIIEAEDPINGSGFDLTLQWNSAEQGSDFDTGRCWVMEYASNWLDNPEAMATSLGGNNYNQSLSGLTDFGAFAVKSLKIVGVHEITTGLLNYFPNPASTEVNVHLPVELQNREVTIELFDQQGRLIQSFRKRVEQLCRVELTGLNLQSGFYLMSIRGQNGVAAIGKIIVNN